MTDSYRTIAALSEGEFKDRGSKFLAYAWPVRSEEEALAHLEWLRKEHFKARHHCFAWRLSPDGSRFRANDDGEPSGTAGRPMLDVLRHQDLEGVLATVVRYFGGVKLGAGGLVRAYTDAVAQALLQAEKVPIVRLATLRCAVPYAIEGLLRRELDAAGASLLAVTHGQAVELCFSLPEDAAAALRARLGEAGQGRIEWLAVPDEVAR